MRVCVYVVCKFEEAAIEHRQALGAGDAGVHVGTPLTAVLFRQLGFVNVCMWCERRQRGRH